MPGYLIEIKTSRSQSPVSERVEKFKIIIRHLKDMIGGAVGWFKNRKCHKGFFLHRYVVDMISDDTNFVCRAQSCFFLSELGVTCWPRRLCVRHPRWRLQCVAGHRYYHRSVSLSFFLFSLSSVFCFWPTSGNLPCVKICFPQYFGITRRYMQKKMLGNFF